MTVVTEHDISREELARVAGSISPTTRCRVGVFVTHPVQYHVPIWRHLAEDPGLECHVYYFSRQGIEKRVDPGFGRSFKWDQNLLEGYKADFLSDVSITDFDNASIPDPEKILRDLDVVLLHGYTHAFARQIVRKKNSFNYKVLLRGEFSDRVTRQRSWLKSQLRTFYLKWFYSQVDAFAYVGHDAQTHLNQHGVAEAKQFFSPYSVDADYFESERQQTCRDTARKSLGIAEGRVCFLFSGKMIERKQPQFMADLANSVKHNSRFQLIMLGDGPLLELTKTMLTDLIREGRALLPGFVNQSELATYFRASDAFVFPSRGDTWGLVANEAMHFGLPCFVSDQVGCGPDLITEGITGHVIEAGNLANWCSVVGHYLDHQAKLREMGNNALKHIQPYTPTNAARGIKQALKYVCTRN